MHHYSFWASSETCDLSGMDGDLHNASFPWSNSKVGNHYMSSDNIIGKINGPGYHYFQIEESHTKVTARFIKKNVYSLEVVTCLSG